MPRLTADQWADVRAEREAGASFGDLASRHNVSGAAICKRSQREGWGGPPPISASSIVDALELERRRVERNKERTRVRREQDLAKERQAIAKSRDQRDRDLAKEHRAIAKKTARFERAVEQGGYVYIVYCEHAGERWHKIGVANDFKARLAVIQTGCPLPVHPILFGWVNAARYIEKQLHEKFASSRVSGEWFSFSDAQVAQALRALSDEISKSSTLEMELLCQG